MRYKFPKSNKELIIYNIQCATEISTYYFVDNILFRIKIIGFSMITDCYYKQVEIDNKIAIITTRIETNTINKTQVKTYYYKGNKISKAEYYLYLIGKINT